MRIARIACFFLLSLSATSSNAQQPYLVASVGPSFASANIDDQFFGDLATLDMGTGWVLGGGAGIDFGFARTELRVDYRSSNVSGVDNTRDGVSASIDSGSLGVLTIFSEYGVDIPVVKEWLEFHIDFGIGAVQLRTDALTDWDFAYNVGGGFYLLRFEPFGIDLNYRYNGTTPGFRLTDPPNAETLHWQAHELTFGIRYVFGAKGAGE